MGSLAHSFFERMYYSTSTSAVCHLILACQPGKVLIEGFQPVVLLLNGWGNKED
jgi:hypothetical protein